MDIPTTPATPPSASPRPRLSRRFGFILLGGILGAALGAFVLAFQLADQDAKFVSMAKLQAAEPVDAADAAGRHWDDFYANMAYDLTSGAVPREAWERVHQRYPRLPLCEVEVEAGPGSRGSIIVVLARGDEPRCVSLYLEALLETYQSTHPGGSAEPGGVDILEHARTGVEEQEEKTLPLLRAAYRGAGLGGLAGLLLSWCSVGKRPSLGKAATPEKLEAELLHQAVIKRRRALVFGILAALAAGSLLGTLVQWVRLGSRPQEFRSLAKVVNVNAPEPTPQTNSQRRIIAVLESPELSRAALERMRKRHPDLRDREVKIEVRQTRGAAVFNVLAKGSDPRYTKMYLDMLLDEFMSVRDQVGNVMVQERANPAAENVEDWQMPLLVGVVVGGTLGAALGALGMLLRKRSSSTGLSSGSLQPS